MKPRAFCEFPAGLASVSLRLHGGEHCRPPISRMGNKAGYSSVILGALGLRSGQGAEAYLWAEASADVRALLRAYPDPAMLRRIAEIIRGWSSEEPRALWERLRAERKARGPAASDADVAGWMFDTANAHGGTGGWKVVPASRPNTTANLSPAGLGDACHRLAEYAVVGQWSFRRCEPESGYNKGVAEGAPKTPTHNAGGPLTVGSIGGRFEDVAAWTWLTGHGDSPKPPRLAAPYAKPEGNDTGSWKAPPREWLADRLHRMREGGWPPVAVLATIPPAEDVAAMLGTPGDLDGVIVYMDPPYVGTTPYEDVLPREDVVRHALAYSALGAVVAVSEAEVVEELDGWHDTEITAGRKGQKRTFSKQKREFLTMNRPPANVVPVQHGLFGA